MIKKLLITSAIFEALTGVLLMAIPSLVASQLLGEESLSAIALTIARIAGAAFVSLAIACIFFRQSVDAVHMVKALLFYNIAVALLLVYGKLSLGLTGNGLLPTTIIHLVLAVWCIVAIQKSSTQSN